VLPEGLELCATAKAARVSAPAKKIPEKTLFLLMKISIPYSSKVRIA
jgi:hypothetical protein